MQLYTQRPDYTYSFHQPVKNGKKKENNQYRRFTSASPKNFEAGLSFSTVLTQTYP